MNQITLNTLVPAQSAPPNIWLALDTSQPEGTAALLIGKQIVYSVKFYSPQGHTENLINIIHSVLEHSHLTLSQVQKVLVTRGPGSFTGLRVSLSHLKGLFWDEPFKIESVLTTEALSFVNHSQNVSHSQFLGLESQLIVTLLNAQKNQVYYQVFESPGLKKIEAVKVAPISEVLDQIAQLAADGKYLNFRANGFISEDLKEFLKLNRHLFKQIELCEWPNFNLAEQMLLHRLKGEESLLNELWHKHSDSFPEIEYARLPEAFSLIKLKKKV